LYLFTASITRKQQESDLCESNEQRTKSSEKKKRKRREKLSNSEMISGRKAKRKSNSM